MMKESERRRLDNTLLPTEDALGLWRCPKCGGAMKVIERLSAAEIQLDRPSSYVPERIVVSAAAFNGSDLKVDKTGEAKLVDTGECDHGEGMNHVKYIVGYFAVVLDTLLDE